MSYDGQATGLAMKEKYGRLAIFVLVIALTLSGLVSYAYYRSTHGWDDAARSLAWSVGVDRDMSGENDRSLLAFEYEKSDSKFLRSIQPPPGFVKNPVSDGFELRVWDGVWQGFRCNLLVSVQPGSYYVVSDC
jgi:hypothetical protein